ncbi:MAG TPA: hypothetical protein VMZ28_02305 [Kofleriaceae bacterium]|nr:hypothetical protein [Kofleriaceae bacterium]
MKREWIAVAALLALGACGEDFVPFNRLASLRVLAVQSEPVAPLTGETTTLTPFTYAPPGVEIESYRWEWCPFPGSSAEGSPCLVTEEEARDLAGAAADTIPPFDLGDDPTATFENSIDDDLLAALCDGAAQVPALADCQGGFPVQVKLTVRTADEEVVTVRTLRLRFDPDSEPNANPTIEGLTAEVDGEEVELDEAAEVALPRRTETTIHAQVPEDASEPYTRLDDQGEPEARRERLILTWFVESGDTSDERTVFIDDSVSLEDATENEWEPAGEDDYPEEESLLIVVVRDGREGVTWGRAAALLEPDP